MVPVISEPDPSHHQNTIHTINISFKSDEIKVIHSVH